MSTYVKSYRLILMYIEQGIRSRSADLVLLPDATKIPRIKSFRQTREQIIGTVNAVDDQNIVTHNGRRNQRHKSLNVVRPMLMTSVIRDYLVACCIRLNCNFCILLPLDSELRATPFPEVRKAIQEAMWLAAYPKQATSAPTSTPRPRKLTKDQIQIVAKEHGPLFPRWVDAWVAKIVSSRMSSGERARPYPAVSLTMVSFRKG